MQSLNEHRTTQDSIPCHINHISANNSGQKGTKCEPRVSVVTVTGDSRRTIKTPRFFSNVTQCIRSAKETEMEQMPQMHMMDTVKMGTRGQRRHFSIEVVPAPANNQNSA